MASRPFAWPPDPVRRAENPSCVHLICESSSRARVRDKMNRRRQSEYSEQDSAVLDRLDRKFRRSMLTYFGRRNSDLSDLAAMFQDVFLRLLKREIGGAPSRERGCQTVKIQGGA